jgi:hypothetical protein
VTCPRCRSLPDELTSWSGAASANNIGANYKASLANKYLVTKQVLSLGPFGMWSSVTTNFGDLDVCADRRTEQRR